jgi:hypothetical protein
MTVSPLILQRPKAVLLAVWLYTFYAALLAPRLWLRGSLHFSWPHVIALTLTFGYFSVIARSLYMRRRWARWWVLFVTAGAIASWPFVPVDVPSGTAELAIFIGQVVTGIAVPGLLLLPSSATWFRS